MVTHIVAWKFRPELTAEQKEQAALEIRYALERLVGEVDGLVSLKVWPLLGTSSHDLILYSLLEDEDALAAYQVHPSHLKAKTVVHRYCGERICLDHEGGSFYAKTPKKK